MICHLPSRLLILLTVIMVFSASLRAAPVDQSGEVELTSEELNELIATLESPTAREEFVKNLKTLSRVAQQESDDSFSLSQALNLNAATAEAVDQYMSSLEQFGISQSLLGALLLVVMSLIPLLLFVYLNKRLARHLNKRIVPLRKKFSLAPNRFKSLFRAQVVFGYILAVSLFIYTIVTLFALWPDGFDRYIDIGAVVEQLITLALILCIATVVWEFSNALLEYVTTRSSVMSESRASTVVPVIRNIMLCAISLIFILIALSELGVNIFPLLAGAGVAGIAVGFGAQALVKDFLTGFIVMFEDLFQVGHVIHVGGRSGLVERITLRKVQLRHLDGTVHTIPFSEVNIVDNYTKEFSCYLFDIGVAYREDVDEVIDHLRAIDEEMRNDEVFGPLILDPLEVLGVEKFADSAVIIRARTKTQPREQWNVGREFNRRIKIRFDQNNIEIPFPHQTLYFGQDKDGSAPNANIALVGEKRAVDKASGGSEAD